MIYYFAYGSNMSPKIFEDRRKIRPTSCQCGVLDGYKLVFNLQGIPYLEPAFANIEKKEDECVEGVVYKITKDELVQLIKTESKHYDVVIVPVSCKKGSMKEAYTFMAHTTVKPKSPSQRYMNHLIEGAEQYKLSKEWRERLTRQTYVRRPLADIYMRLVFPLASYFMCPRDKDIHI